MKAASMQRLLAKQGWWNNRTDWPPYICFHNGELAFILGKRNENWRVAKAVKDGLRCYQKINDNNDYKLLKVKDVED